MQLNITKTGFTKVSDIRVPSTFYRRMKTGVAEFDNLFGDGILPGSSMTFTGQAGCGKTTALLQMMEALAINDYEVGYASGEENAYQLAFTCKRLNVKNVSVANETDIDVLAKAMKDLDVLVIDSFQALTTTNKLNHAEHERYAVSKLVDAAKLHECVLIFVMHFTKSGNQLKGSSLIPHAVDLNLMITIDDEGEENARILSVYKNRFGPTGEYSAEMTPTGLVLSGKREVVKSKSKKSRQKEQLEQILAINEPPHLTKEVVINTLEVTPSQAYLLLKELTDTSKLVKFGRGASAIYKHKIATKQTAAV